MKRRWPFVLAVLVILFGPPFLILGGLHGFAWLLYRAFDLSFPSWLGYLYVKGYGTSVLGVHVLLSVLLMALLTRREKPVETGQFLLIAVAVPFATPFLALGVLSRLHWLIYRWLPAISFTLRPVAPIDAYCFLSARILSDMTRSAIISLSALALTAAALVWLVVRERGEAWRRGRFYVLLVALISVSAFPFVMRYQPVVRPAADARMHVVEKPALLAGAVKSCQAAAEVQTYIYEPLGWADAETLVYRKWFGGHYDQEGTWQPGEAESPKAYRLDTQSVSSFDGSVEALWRETCPPAVCVRPALAPRERHEQGYHPGQYDEAVISPDGHWVAFTAEHIYGPEDLLVISSGS